MGFSNSYHGSSAQTGPSWEEMSPEQKEAFLVEQKAIKARQAAYEEEQNKKKIIKGVFIGILVIVLLVILIIAISSCAPYMKKGWEEGQKIAEELLN